MHLTRNRGADIAAHLGARSCAAWTGHPDWPHRWGAADVRRARSGLGAAVLRFRDRQRWWEFLDFCRQLRRRFPTGRLYLVCDNNGAHQKAEVLAWCADHGIELVFTPSNASWLNWIECEFTAPYFTLDGSDYPSHAAQETAIARYIRWTNRHATPKRRFAVISKIRRPDYLPNVA